MIWQRFAAFGVHERACWMPYAALGRAMPIRVQRFAHRILVPQLSAAQRAYIRELVVYYRPPEWPLLCSRYRQCSPNLAVLVKVQKKAALFGSPISFLLKVNR
jgi:hypothetical protein